MDKIVKTVMKNLMEVKYSTRIFEQLIRIDNEAKSEKDPIGREFSFREYCPFIKKDYSIKEIKTLKKLLSEAIVEQLQKDNTYLQTARLIHALECLGDFRKLPKNSNKIKFIRKCLYAFYDVSLSLALRDISLLDNI